MQVRISAIRAWFCGYLLVAFCGCSNLTLNQPVPSRGDGAESSRHAIAGAVQSLSRSSNAFKLLYSFGGVPGGADPAGPLTQVGDLLYGTTVFGGENGCDSGSGCGTVFSVSKSGKVKILHRFGESNDDGAFPYGPLTDVNGVLYGTTSGGGTSGYGTVYSITTSGTYHILHRFSGGADGWDPQAGLLNVHGTLFGTTDSGGGSGCFENTGCGTVYSISTSGSEKVLYSFAGGSDGSYPESDLVEVAGVLYGTTSAGGSDNTCGGEFVGCGTVFSVTPSGQETVLYRFAGGSDGAEPLVGLTDVNGTLFGTTYQGGGDGCEGTGCGVVFSVSTSGQETVLHSFAGGNDGASPFARLTDVSGVLYGTTTAGGGSGCGGAGCGTLFSITLSGNETVLHSFARAKGEKPFTNLTNSSGTLFGSTYYGGAHGGAGTLFSYTL